MQPLVVLRVARRSEFGIAVLNDTIIVCGGYSPNFGYLSSCEQFAASAGGTGDGAWSLLPGQLQAAVAGLAMAAAGGQVYAMGGYYYVEGQQ